MSRAVGAGLYPRSNYRRERRPILATDAFTPGQGWRFPHDGADEFNLSNRHLKQATKRQTAERRRRERSSITTPKAPFRALESEPGKSYIRNSMSTVPESESQASMT